VGTLAFKIGGSHQAALKLLEAVTRLGELALGWDFAGGDENAVVVALPWIAVEISRAVSSAISRAVMRYSMVRLSPRSMTPVQARIGVIAKASPGCGERTSSDPK
jgi:hypothetical protein